MKTSNKFTLSRVLFAPVFFLLYNLPIWLGNGILAKISAVVMIPSLIVIQLTDYWDGHYARKYNEVSDFGKLFDPFADVFLNLTLFVCAMKSFAGFSYMPTVLFILIMYREFAQTFLRMVAVKQGVAIGARKGGKVKTVFYISAAFYMLAIESAIRLGLDQYIGFLIPYLNIGALVLFIVCVILSYTSFVDYLINFSSVLKKNI